MSTPGSEHNEPGAIGAVLNDSGEELSMTNEFRSTLRALAGMSTLLAGLLALSPAAVAQSTATLTNSASGATTSCTIQTATITYNGAISVSCSTDPTNLGSSTPPAPAAAVSLSAATGNLTTTGTSSASVTATCTPNSTGTCNGVAIQLAVVSPATGVTLSASTHTFTGTGTSPAFTAFSAGGLSAGAVTLRLTVTAAGTGVTTTPAVADATGITGSISIVDNTTPPPVTTGGTNVALAANGGVATGSSQLAGYPITAVNDGNRQGPTNGFWADGTPSTFPDSVEVAFNGSKTLTRVVVYSVQDAYTSPVEPTDTQTFSQFGLVAFTIEGWDGAAWVNLATVTGNNLVKRTVAVSYTTTKIRVNVTNAMAVYSRIVEIEAFDNSTAPPPAGGGGGSSTACTTSATYMQTAGIATNQYFFGWQEGMGISGSQSIAVAFKPVTDYGNGVLKYGGTEAVQQLPGNNASRDIQHVISTCPGDFTNLASPNGICSRFGTDGAGGLSYHTANSTTVQINSCGPLDPTKTYYINARYVNPATGGTTCIASGGLCYTVIGLQPQ